MKWLMPAQPIFSNTVHICMFPSALCSMLENIYLDLKIIKQNATWDKQKWATKCRSLNLTEM